MVNDMRVSIDLSAKEAWAIRRVAEESRRTVAGEIAWAVVSHVRAKGYCEPGAVEPPPGDHDDEHPF